MWESLWHEPFQASSWSQHGAATLLAGKTKEGASCYLQASRSPYSQTLLGEPEHRQGKTSCISEAQDLHFPSITAYIQHSLERHQMIRGEGSLRLVEDTLGF